MNALILVDLQNDFTPEAPGKPAGALAVPGGGEVIAVANQRMPDYDVVVATQDWHPPDHQSFASQHSGHPVGGVVDLHGLEQILWPDHCVQGTPGAEFCADLNTDAIHHVVRKGTDRDIDSYSGFFDNGHRKATGLTDLLRHQSGGVEDVHIMGLATDYCVQFTALDAVREGFRTHLILEGCRGVDLQPGDCDRAILTMREAGVLIED